MFGKTLTASWPAGAQIAAASVVAIGGLSLTTSGVWAALQATANNSAAPMSVTTGTLKLVMADNGAGLTTSVTAMAPGDTLNRFVALTNNGTLAGKALTLGAAVGTSNALSDATKGLTIAITSCSVAWNNTANTCGGSQSSLLSATSVATLITTPTSLIPGAIAVDEVQNLRVTIALPNTTETTTNGTLPPSTIQGLSTTLTVNFTETQRDGSTTSA